MKVKELINHLMKADQEAEVGIYYDQADRGDIEMIWEYTDPYQGKRLVLA